MKTFHCANLVKHPEIEYIGVYLYKKKILIAVHQSKLHVNQVFANGEKLNVLKLHSLQFECGNAENIPDTRWQYYMNISMLHSSILWP